MAAQHHVASPRSSTTATTLTAVARWGWRILVAVATLLVLNGAALFLFIVDTQIERTVGVLLAAFGAVTLMVALEGLRSGSRWAWHTMWVVVAALMAIAAHTLRADRLDVPLTYLVLGLIAIVGQLCVRRDLTQ